MPNFADHKEWFAAARKLHREKGYNAAQIKEEIGLFEGFRIDNSTSEGIKKINLATKAKKDTDRNARSKAPESTKQFFQDELSFKQYLSANNQDVRGINARTRLASKERGIDYNKGHVQSSKKGGSWTSRNFNLENSKRNFSHGRASPERAALLNAGFPVDWNNDAINYQDPSGLPQEYTPKDKQKILNAPADQIDEVTAAVDKQVWDRIKANPNARPIRTNPNPQVTNPPTKQNFDGLTISANKPGLKKPRAPNRKALKALAVAGVAAPSVIGTGVSAAETTGRAQLAMDTKNPIDFVQTAISGLSLLADFIPGVGEFISTPADLANLTIDGHREPKTVKSQVEALNRIKLNR